MGVTPMSEPVIQLWIGALNAISQPLLSFWIGVALATAAAFSVKPLMRSRLTRRALQRLDHAAPSMMVEIEADMEQLHSQIAVATRRLEMSVEQMKAKTTGQLAEIGKTSETIARLKGEITERSAALALLEDKARACKSELQTIEGEVTAKTIALLDLDKVLADRKAELAKFLAEFDVHPTLAKAEARHKAEMEQLASEKMQVEERLRQSRDECLKLQYELEGIGKQVETTWASERLANAVLRERINDVASEVVRVAVALEGLGSPMDKLIAGKSASAQAAQDVAVQLGESGRWPAIVDGAEDSKTSLIHRIRALRNRAAQSPALVE
jgi:chromosome segregation ATPase